MRFLPALAAAFLVGGVLPASAQHMIREKVGLCYKDAVGMLKALPREKWPAGVAEITAHPEDNSLIARGTAGGLEALNARLQRLDKQVKQVRLEMRLTRFDFDAGGVAKAETVSKPTVVTLDNGTATVGVHSKGAGAQGGHEIKLLPHINADGSLRLAATLRLLNSSHATLRQAHSVRTLRKPQERMLLGLTDSTDAAVQKEVEKGQIPSQPGKYAVYYLQITPVVETEGRSDLKIIVTPLGKTE
jgi:hypothetical protein